MARSPRRRKRHHVQAKPKQAAKARWYASRGFAYTWIAAKIGAHRNSVRRWASGTNNRTIDRLATRIRNLSRAERSELLERVARGRRTA